MSQQNNENNVPPEVLCRHSSAEDECDEDFVTVEQAHAHEEEGNGEKNEKGKENDGAAKLSSTQSRTENKLLAPPIVIIDDGDCCSSCGQRKIGNNDHRGAEQQNAMREVLLANKAMERELEVEQMRRELLARQKMMEKMDGAGANQNKLALLDEKMENLKLNARIQKGEDAKQMRQLQQYMRVIEQKVEKLAESANEKIDQLKEECAASQKKQEEAKSRLEQMHTTMESLLKKVDMLERSKLDKWRLCNPTGNTWNNATTQCQISEDGLSARCERDDVGAWKNVFATKLFHTNNQTHGIDIKYFEINLPKGGCCVFGLSADNNFHAGPYDTVGQCANSYSIFADGCVRDITVYSVAGVEHNFECPPRYNSAGEHILNWAGDNVFGCGLVVWPNRKRCALFFTANGTLLGKSIPIGGNIPLYPAASLLGGSALEANFGDNPTIPFAYDFKKCSGMELDAVE